MDILGQYEKQNPQAPKQSPRWNMSQEFQEESFLTRMVIKWSGGRIRDARQANRALLGIAILFSLLTFFVIAQLVNLLPAKRFSAEDAAKQLKEYKKIQPF